MNGQTYNWDYNGNLLSDGVNTYSYNAANRLISISNQSSAVSFAYNGQGDRLIQTVGITTTNYTLDLAAGLTQVLADGTNSYLHGLDRIGEQQPGGWQYHLGDALGSVRQLTNSVGDVLLAKDYQPYGEVLGSAGSATTSYGYTGEYTDATGLVYLRARYYSSGMGRFLTRDTWGGDYIRPMSYNSWLYGYGNIINQTDPTGHDSYCDSQYSDPDECNSSLPPFRPSLCDRNCVIDAAKPLKSWGEIFTLPNPTRALFMRLLLSEIGWRLIGNANWQTEGTALLWTVENRVRWERARVLLGDRSKMSQFKPCHLGYYQCMIISRQYYGLNQPRARDPLYINSYNTKEKQASYFHDVKYVSIALERAYLVAIRFLSGTPDPTDKDGLGGAHFMAHETTTAVFRRRVDRFCEKEYIESYKEVVLKVPYIESIPFVP
jgi:RHS repeat-associated protein